MCCFIIIRHVCDFTKSLRLKLVLSLDDIFISNTNTLRSKCTPDHYILHLTSVILSHITHSAWSVSHSTLHFLHLILKNIHIRWLYDLYNTFFILRHLMYSSLLLFHVHVLHLDTFILRCILYISYVTSHILHPISLTFILYH